MTESIQSRDSSNLITGDSYYREYNDNGQLMSVKQGNTSSGKLLEEYWYDSNGDRIKVKRYTYTTVGTNETIYTPYREWLQLRNKSGTYNRADDGAETPLNTLRFRVYSI